MTIHGSYPFPERPDPVRRARGRLATPVTLWTAGEESTRVGSAVSSTQMVQGEPARMIGLLDPLASILEVIEQTDRWTVGVLGPRHRAIAETFGGYGPQPGGPFRAGDWQQTEWGPIEASVTTWFGVELEGTMRVGDSALLVGKVAHLTLGDDEPLIHWRGRFGQWTRLGP